MSKTFLGLAIYMALVTGVHVMMGGPEYASVFKAELSTDEYRAMALVLWHAVTVILILLSLAYLRLAKRFNNDLLWFTTAIQIGWAALFVYYGLSWVGDLITLPQWILFLISPIVAHIAARRRKTS